MTVTAALLAVLAVAAAGFAWTQRRDARVAREERDQARDTLEEARAAEAEARTAAERATLARDSFFDLATHELRSPLAAILGYQELIQDGAYGALDPNAVEPVERIGRSATHLLHLIEGVVELSRIRGGGFEPDLEPVNLQVVLSSLADTFRSRAEERRITPVVHMSDPLPVIRTDVDRLQRALDLLITSAVKHPADDTLHMTISVDDADRLDLAISETAIQPRDEMDDPALRLGIRLAIAGGIARLLGGDLDLQTGDDGTIRSLRFRIPAAPVASDQVFDDGAPRG